MKKKMEIQIDSLAFGGAGVGRVDGKVCFVHGALPGEKVLFEVGKDTSKFIEGRVKEIITPSADRIDPLCPYYGICGGCQLQHLSYDKELFYKQQQVKDTVSRIAGVKDLNIGDIVGSPSPYGYRSSVTLHSSGGKYGYYKQFTRNVVEIDRCLIAEDAINEELPLKAGSGAKKDVNLKADSSGRVWSSARSGERFFFDNYGDTKMCLSAKAFSQVNKNIAVETARKLDEWIAEAGGGDVLFDAYCGVGFFSFLLKSQFEKRIGMDESRIAIDCAKSTMKNKSDIFGKFYKGDVEKEFLALFEREKGKHNVLILDPPRTGSGKAFLERLGALEDIDQLYYLSCDPGRLARDIKVLTEGGKWSLGRAQPFDMFPRTKHIEVLVEFKRIACSG